MSDLEHIMGDPPARPQLLTDAERAELARERAAPPPPPWYDGFVALFTHSQARTETHLRGVSVHHRGVAARHRAMAEQRRIIAAAEEELAAAHEAMAIDHEALAVEAEGLAESIPTADQAAADLGTAAERHDVDGLRGVLLGEQQLRERDVQTILARIAQLEQAWQSDRDAAERQRAAILQALTTRGEVGHGDL